MQFISLTYLPLLLLATSPTLATTCRNLTRTTFSTDSDRQFSTTDSYILERVVCPRNTTANPTKCTVPRGVYDLTIRRVLNVSVSAEDKDAIFEAARLGYWGRTDLNETLWDDAWDDKPRNVDTRGDEWGDLFFETRENMNYSLAFVPFMRWGSATLGGCDNETLNGMGVAFRAPYWENNTVEPDMTEVAGTLIGSGSNITTTNASGRLTVNNAGVLAMMGLGTVFAVML